jgi:large subunit ribosomal protein L3
MSIGCLGTKVGMTQVFNNNGHQVPVTLIKLGPCYITQIKTVDVHGYNAVQIGYLECSPKHKQKLLSKGQIGHLKKSNLPLMRHLKEYKVDETSSFKIGDQICASFFSSGGKVSVTGKTSGKGNAGNIKKHGFKRGAMSHGSKHHRAQGSLGAGTTPSRVFPGKKMSGRLGNLFQTIKGLTVIESDAERNLLIIKGSVPGKFGNLISVSKN